MWDDLPARPCTLDTHLSTESSHQTQGKHPDRENWLLDTSLGSPPVWPLSPEHPTTSSQHFISQYI